MNTTEPTTWPMLLSGAREAMAHGVRPLFVFRSIVAAVDGDAEPLAFIADAVKAIRREIRLGMPRRPLLFQVGRVVRVMYWDVRLLPSMGKTR